MKVVSLCMVALLTLCATACKEAPSVPAKPVIPAGIAVARAKIVNILKDPNSVMWRNELQGSDGTTLCGEVNAKNSMGGYVGFKKFIANGWGYLLEDGKYASWDMASNRDPVPDHMIKAASLIDDGSWLGGDRDVWEFFWNSNCK